MAKKRVARNPLLDEKPIGTPLGEGPDGEPLRCNDGCGRIADGRDWDTLAPSSWRCWIEMVVQGISERAAEREAAKAARVQQLADARAIARGEDPEDAKRKKGKAKSA